MSEAITDNLDLWSSALLTRSTAGRGSNGKLEAYGIKKLRELILQLAVRGKLVPQDANNEPASELLKRIQTEKKKLIAEGKIKKDKPLPPITDEEKPFTQPQGWEWVRLGEIAEIIRGVTYGKSDASDIPQADYVPLLRGNNINRTLNFDSPVFVPKQLLNDAQYVKAGDIVIAMSSGSADLVGKAAQATEDLEGGFGAFCGVIRPVSAETHSFSGFFFQTPLYRNRAAGHGKGIGINNLQKTMLQTLEIPLPPIKEQHRIVAKVDELMALCDQLEQQQTHSIEAHQTLVASLLGTLTYVESQQEFSAAWARIASHFDTLFTTEASIDQLKQTILQLAVMGKLVPQDPKDEPASVFLEKIAQEKAMLIKAGMIRKQKELPEIKKDEEIGFNLPTGWAVSRLGTFTNVGTGATPSRDKTAYWSPQEVSWVASGETSNDFITETCEKVSSLAIKETNVTVYPVGTLIVAMYGQGKTRGQVSELMIEAGTNQACAAVVLTNKDEAHRKYLKLFFKKAYEEMRSHSAGGAQPNLNVGKISNTVVPLPPLAEQHRIVAKVDELMALSDALKSRLADAQAIQLHLADAIVEQAVC